IEEGLRLRENELTALARSRSILDYTAHHSQTAASAGAPDNFKSRVSAENSSARLSTAASQNPAANDPELDKVEAEINSFLLGRQKYYSAITCLHNNRQVLFRGEMLHEDNSSRVSLKTEALTLSDPLPDDSFWTTLNPGLIRSPVIKESFGAALRYIVPVVAGEKSFASDALIFDLKLDPLLRDAASDQTGIASTQNRANAQTASPRLVVILDHEGNIIYHTNEALRYQVAASAMPASFKPIAEAMKAGESGESFYDSSGGERWLVVYRPIATRDLAVAVAANQTAATKSLRRRGWIVIIASTLVGLFAAALLTHLASRTSRSIENITENAAAIAGGRLDQRLEVRSSDDLRPFADTFNQMKDQLREQMAREAEARQFQSFMRLSAMLTHDLKNAISALLLLVSNMERQFHREEFRADALVSLKAAADKLSRLVSKLSDPVETLSGEYKRPMPTDLLPMIRRVMAANAEPARPAIDIETRLPETLVAPVDAERIEKVFENLVINAIEAMSAQDKQGKLTVEAGEGSDSDIFIKICDTGPGMSEEFQRKRLFHPFATTKRKGVGLGLYTCREVVRAHGGHIDVESKEGFGTCFRVVLPSKQITWTKDRSGQSGAAR
ncbi:MAG: ATP-binding protein, partial [Pyrinomonadaceae bacterium]